MLDQEPPHSYIHLTVYLTILSALIPSVSIILFYVQAAELLRHPLLQPHVLKIHLKSSPFRNSLPVHQSANTYMNEIRYPESKEVSLYVDQEKRRSFSNDRMIKPGTPTLSEQNYCSARRKLDSPNYMNQRVAELSVGSSNVEEIGVCKVISTKMSNVAKTPRSTPAKAKAKASATPRRQTEPSKIAYGGRNRESLPAESRTPADRSVRPTRRASLPLPARASNVEAPSRPSIGLLHRMSSPDVSVNAPRIDRIAEFPLASSEDPLFPICNKPSTPAVRGSSNYPPSGDRSITKDKCTVLTRDRAFSRPSFSSETANGIRRGMIWFDGDEGSEFSDRNPVGEASSRGSSDSRQRRFDTSSYQQRAEALEGLLEFSAQLLQQERIEELGILLKPFGPEKASPRETAIWLTKSFKETTSKQDLI